MSRAPVPGRQRLAGPSLSGQLMMASSTAYTPLGLDQPDGSQRAPGLGSRALNSLRRLPGKASAWARGAYYRVRATPQLPELCAIALGT